MRFAVDASAVLAPVGAMLALRAFGPGGEAGVYRACLLGLVVATAIGAFATPTLRALLVRVPGLAILAGIAHAISGSGVGSAGAVALLFLAVAMAAAGLAALARRVRTPDLPGAAIAAIVLWIAMAGLYWADPVAELLPRTAQRSFRQAVLHVDPALALAYDGADYERLRAPDVYFDVPLASSLFERPHASSTAMAWLAVGILAAGGGKWGRRRSTAGGRREGENAGARSPPHAQDDTSV